MSKNPVLAAVMQIFIDFHQGLRGPYGKGLVGHYASGHFLNPPLPAAAAAAAAAVYCSVDARIE